MSILSVCQNYLSNVQNIADIRKGNVITNDPSWLWFFMPDAMKQDGITFFLFIAEISCTFAREKGAIENFHQHV
jgi:hypothetical protein